MINNLPKDALSLIFKQLCRHEKALCRFVCKRWSSIISPKKWISFDEYIESLSLLRWAYNNKVPAKGNAISCAAHFWQLDMMKIFHKKGYTFDYDTLEMAIVHGDIEILDWLVEKKCEWVKGFCVPTLAKKEPYLLKWAMDKKLEIGITIVDYALAEGNIKLLDWMFTEGGWKMDNTVPYLSACTGNTTSMQWVKDHGGIFDENCYAWAANHGQLASIEWLIDNGYPWDENMIDEFAGKNNLEGLKRAREMGAPCDYFALIRAVEHENYDMILFLEENGCPWTQTSTYGALHCNNQQIRDYARQNCPAKFIKIY